jgi:phage gp29-like protein
VLHIPGGRIAPWQWGLWAALGRAFINKEHAISLRAALIAGVANPAKVLQAPSGATEQQRKAMFQHLLHWGPNMAVELPVGWEMKLLELTGGKAYEIFQREIDTCDLMYMVALAGQVVTTTGGAGFSNADVHRVIRSDLIKASAEALSYTVSTQILPQYVYYNHGGDSAVDGGTHVMWDTDTPKDQQQTAQTLQVLAAALTQLGTIYPDLSYDEMATRFGLPIKQNAPEQGPPKQTLELVDESGLEAAAE